MRAGILIGTAAAALGVIASSAPASAEPCPPEVCSIPGLPGGSLPFNPQMSDLPQDPMWMGQAWDWLSKRDNTGMFDTPGAADFIRSQPSDAWVPEQAPPPPLPGPALPGD
ncbi:hypothetical protein BKG69_23100 [Mycobacteroides chelonae]|jgi:hypothetical protein|uniref:Secreted protein n=1 Tax=Mycobacteroides chelonae TaxID=1774 RepID=A0AB73N6X1_MYCCH|nr:hypothetical protein BKG63_25085 [Mycobacteroides chelonae]OHT49309.1 hypothetical protein BKG62_16940 [Mycobacteroides chelonae]OHT59913.1 hypothetical protein BKG64_13860 [Mycobacteroides chelonae]OHT62093.1 hypothetical protein BKG65_15860 [Mycobacteroides chelonae]OHT77281.1 hypothetical protein BKG69_23100 [Mycobacteroides chelonae]